jgi:hypothetical protein
MLRDKANLLCARRDGDLTPLVRIEMLWIQRRKRRRKFTVLDIFPRGGTQMAKCLDILPRELLRQRRASRVTGSAPAMPVTPMPAALPRNER